MNTYWDNFIEEKLKSIPKCGTCGASMMPTTKLLEEFFRYLQKNNKIKTDEENRKLKEMESKNGN